MKKMAIVAMITIASALASTAAVAENATVDATVNKGIDALYTEITRTVEETDFTGMLAAYHADAIIVTSSSVMPITSVMKRWKQQGEAAQKQGINATVSFKIKNRKFDDTSAFDQGIFFYQTVDANGKTQSYKVHFEGLLINKNGKWLWMMERQMEAATDAEWNAIQ
jgi:hypothetical protein